MMDLDEQVCAIIRANVEANRRLESFYAPDPPKELVMSLDTVKEQHRKVNEIASRMRARHFASMNVLGSAVSEALP
jgi:hypothetical protein